MKKYKTAAVLSIDRPGSMTKRGRKAIAKWLRDRAKDLEDVGDGLSDTGWFRARYLYR